MGRLAVAAAIKVAVPPADGTRPLFGRRTTVPLAMPVPEGSNDSTKLVEPPGDRPYGMKPLAPSGKDGAAQAGLVTIAGLLPFRPSISTNTMPGKFRAKGPAPALSTHIISRN